MPEWLAAGGSGLPARGALLVGSAIAWLIPVPEGDLMGFYKTIENVGQAAAEESSNA